MTIGADAAEERRRDERRGTSVWRRALASEYWVLALSVAYFLALWPFAPGLASPGNLYNLFSNLLPLLVVAVGQTFVLISGGIDLSATSVIALASVVGGFVMSADQGFLPGGSSLAVPAGIFSMLLAGALVGLLNGLAIARLRMPPFVVTLTAMMFFSGLAIWLTRSRNIYNLPASFNALGKGSFSFIPYALLIAAPLTLLAHLSLSRTLYGRRLYAVGANARAARVSGVPVEATVVRAYLVSGLCAAAASMLYTGRLETGSPVLGQRILLDVVGAVVIGGTSLFGGKGRIHWTLFGVLFITLLDNSLNMLGLSYFVVMMVKGGVILGAALFDAARVRLLSAR